MTSRRLFVIILMGLPASGKTTWSAQFYPSFTRIDGDSLKTGPKVVAYLDRILSLGQDCIVDATNGTIERRSGIIETARRHNAWIIGVVFKADAKTCVQRAIARAESGGPKVPAIAIHTCNSRFIQPTFNEGFDVLAEALSGS